MNKISNAQMAEVFSDAAATLRAQQAENADLRTKLAAYETRNRVEKLAATMHSKGMELDVDVTELANRLEKAAEKAGELEVIEKAVDMSGPDMATKIGAAAHNP